MQIELIEKNYCQYLVKYEADKEEISNKRKEIVNKFHAYKIPGFRKGKSNSEAVSMFFRKEIDENLKQELANEAINNTLTEKDIKPFGQPKFESINLENNKFNCEFSIHTKPNFELSTYKGFEIPKAPNKTNAEEFSQKMLQEIRVRMGTSIPFTDIDFAQVNDQVIVDYKGSIDGIINEKLSVNGEILTVGKVNLVNFDDNILGMKIDEVRNFDIVMPEQYGEELNGKTVSFEVKLLNGSKTTPAPLDDELAKKLGIETFELLMNEIKSTADGRIYELERGHNADQVAKRLIENHTFQVPDWIIAAEAQVNTKNNQKDWLSISDEDKQKSLDDAEKSVKLSLILEQVRDSEPDAQLTEDELFKLTKMNIEKTSPNPDQVLMEIVKNGHLPFVFNRIKDEFTLDFIIKNSTIIE